MSMQARRFRADIQRTGGGRIAIVSTSWQTVTLMTPQDQGYRTFIAELHRKMKEAGSKASLTSGMERSPMPRRWRCSRCWPSR